MSIRLRGYVDFRGDPDCLLTDQSPSPPGVGPPPVRNDPDSRARCPRCGSALVVEGRGRLYNRETVWAAIGRAGPPAQMGDADLLREAYAHFGPDCGLALDGAWVLAACCLPCRQLDLIRDASGSAQVYYTWFTGRFEFSFDLKYLVRHRVELDEECLARTLAGIASVETATVFRGVSCLPPAHRLVVTPEGPRQRRYWSTTHVRPLVLRDMREYGEVLHSALVQAVSTRLPSSGNTGLLLSAGFDSSVLAAVAAPLMETKADGLVALTHVPGTGQPGGVYNEGPAAAELTMELRGVAHRNVWSDGWPPVDALRRWHRIFGAPASANSNVPFLFALTEAAVQCRATRLLTGQLGNLTMDWGRAGLGGAALVRGGQYREAARRIARPVRRFVRVATGAQERGPSRLSATSEHSLRLNRNWRRRRDDEVVFAAARMGRIHELLGREFGIVVADPFLARPLIELVAALPPALWLGPQDRWPFREAMEGRLPDRVRYRRWKGVQSADFGHRLASSSRQINDLFDEIESSPSARQYVDLTWCRRAVTSLGAGYSRGHGETASWLMLGLEVALFLSGIDRGEWSDG